MRNNTLYYDNFILTKKVNNIYISRRPWFNSLLSVMLSIAVLTTEVGCLLLC